MAHRGETTQSVMIFFEDLLFTDKKNDVKVLGVFSPDTPATVAFFVGKR